MSIFGIGVDIVEIDRVASSIERFGQSFAEKILHHNEFERYLELRFKERYLAKRFAAKEAFAKALGTGLVDGVTLPRIEIVNYDSGKPHIVLHEKTKEIFDSLKLHSIHLSISDEKKYAVAQVVLEK